MDKFIVKDLSSNLGNSLNIDPNDWELVKPIIEDQMLTGEGIAWVKIRCMNMSIPEPLTLAEYWHIVSAHVVRDFYAMRVAGLKRMINCSESSRLEDPGNDA
jgi:hypothetical protein